MLIQLCARLVLVKQGKPELLHFFEVVVNNKLLGEGRVEVVHSCFCPVELQRQKKNGQSGIYALHLCHCNVSSLTAAGALTSRSPVLASREQQARSKHNPKCMQSGLHLTESCVSEDRDWSGLKAYRSHSLCIVSDTCSPGHRMPLELMLPHLPPAALVLCQSHSHL